VALGLAVVAAITAVALLRARRDPSLLCGWLWFVGMLVPVLGIVQVGDQAHCDHYTYLPAIGLTVALVWLGAEAVARVGAPRALGWAAAGLALVGCALDTRAQIPHWRDSRTLFTHMLAVDPDNHLGHINLGMTEAAAGHLDLAIAHYRRAVELRPGQPRAWVDLGSALLTAGEPTAAKGALQRAVALDPDLLGAQLDLAIAEEELGEVGPAAGRLAKVLALDPGYRPAWDGLRSLLSRPDGPRQALPYVRAVARAEPGSVLLGQLVVMIGRRAGGAPVEPSHPTTGAAPRAPGQR
jgi:tetratricopeptide (TPR) repeat protein